MARLLERSLRQFGFVQPVLARREDRTVIGGHQRLVAARRRGLTTVPVSWLDISVEQARLLGLALNKISGSWDEQLLARLLAELRATPDLDLSLSGFDEDEVRDLLRSLEAWRSGSGPRRSTSTRRWPRPGRRRGRSPASCGSLATTASSAATRPSPTTSRGSSPARLPPS